MKHLIFINRHIHNQGIQKDNLTKKDYKGLFWILITFIVS
jgi:hypothetical protein